MSKTLKIGFWNAQGLSILKWNKLINEFSSMCYDIFFVAETWFVNHSFYSQHPLYLCSSTILPKSINQSRNKAGIYCLASSHVKSLISNVDVNSYYINLSLCGNKISCVYLPPSLNSQDVIQNLPSSPVSLLIGDINTQFGVAFGTKKSGPNKRIQIFKELCNNLQLNHIRLWLRIAGPSDQYVLNTIRKLLMRGAWIRYSFFCLTPVDRDTDDQRC